MYNILNNSYIAGIAAVVVLFVIYLLSPETNSREAPYWSLFIICQYKGGYTMLLKECNRCHNLIPYGLPYCSVCGPIVAKEREERRAEAIKDSNRRYNKTRDPKYVRFYNSTEWRILSSKRLQDDNYICAMCGGVATEVDHIKAIQTPEGWELRLDYNNTQSLCTVCHNHKHDRFKKRRPISRLNGS